MANLNLVPHTALTFDTVVLMRDDGLFLRVKKGLGEVPMVRGEDQIVPHDAGRFARSRVADRLLIELEGYVWGIGDADGDPSEGEAYYVLVAELRTLFDPTKDPATLSCVLPDGDTMSTLVRVVPPVLWDEVLPGRIAKLNVEMESIVPTWTIA